MWYYGVKVLVSAVLIVAISEIGKRSSCAGAILASLPLTSILAMVWLFAETKDVQKIAALSGSIFWLVIPSLILFVVLPVLLKKGMGFAVSLGLSMTATVLGYFLMLALLQRLGIRV
jgi:hypothetical protein